MLIYKMKILLTKIVLIFFTLFTSFAQADNGDSRQKYALVIGNANYSYITQLRNPEYDAKDMGEALKAIGFQTDLQLNSDISSMESSLAIFINKLASDKEAIGIFYYAGHGIQYNGENYLIPIDANIQSEIFLRSKTLSLQTVMEGLKTAENFLNIVILDACRDNPFPWNRNLGRGLTIVGTQPAGSIIAYATSAGSVAKDGEGRNGVFTAELLKNIVKPGYEIADVLKMTGADVQNATKGAQTPAIYNQFFGSVFLAGKLDKNFISSVKPVGKLTTKTETDGKIYIDKVFIDSVRSGGMLEIGNLNVGKYDLEIRYEGGHFENRSIEIKQNETTEANFTWKIEPKKMEIETTQHYGIVEMIHVDGGTFIMGSNVRSQDEKPAHEVTLNSFLISKYEVTQGQYVTVMGNNPSFFQAEPLSKYLPVETVTWLDAIKFCNKLSEIEGYDLAYRIIGDAAYMIPGNDGYRLPTEAEWEFAAKGGTQSKKFQFSGADDIETVGVHGGNYKNTGRVGSKMPNELGLYDMSGNVWEWCWDRMERYTITKKTNPASYSNIGICVIRGGAFSLTLGDCAVTNRVSMRTNTKNKEIGFRIVKNVKM